MRSISIFQNLEIGVKYRFFGTGTANKVLQKTKTAIANFRIFLSHNGLVAHDAWLPVVRGGVGF
jgi:hypothetical protein